MVLGFLNIGTSEMVFIVIIILLLFGGKKLPELARGLGKGIREFKDASEDIKREISSQINNFEKDVDVVVNDKPKPAAAVVATEAVVEKDLEESPAVTEDAVAEEKKFPQFSAPEGTFQHDPGAHPVNQEEYYKYGYNDHFVSDETVNTAETEEVKSTSTSSSDSETKQA